VAGPSDDVLREAGQIATRVARRYLMTDRRGEAVSADDVAQDVLIALLKQDLDAIDNWRAWVNQAARNRAIDIVRRGTDPGGAVGRRGLRTPGCLARLRDQRLRDVELGGEGPARDALEPGS
jgi:DNA-directed RNA polymerase specialized sigma24 family protein